jgi:phage shock protein A
MFDGFKALSRVRQLEDEFRELKRRMELLEVGWTDTLDKFKQIMGRIEKRAARAEAAATDGHSVVDPTSNGISPGLSANQQAINAKILARRNRLALPIKGGE